MKARVLCLLVLSATASCDSRTTSESGAKFEDRSDALSVGFDRKAGYVTFDTQGNPTFDPIETNQPVLHFAGMNADNSFIAYTSLAKHEPSARAGSAITLAAAMNLELSELVPTGALVVEDASGNARTITRPGAFIVAAAWHPTKPRAFAYSYMEGDSYGVAVFDLDRDSSVDAVQGDLTPELLAWSDDGAYVGAYMVDDTLPRKAPSDDREGAYDKQHRWQYVALDSSAHTMVPTFGGASLRFAQSSPEMKIALDGGSHITMPEGPTSTNVILERPFEDGRQRISFRADQVRHLTKKGVAFVNFDGGRAELLATNGIKPPQSMSAALVVSYYIPLHATEDSTFTQVGSGYGGGCLVDNHTGNLAYAVDIQIPTTSYDEVIASANGTTAGGVSSVTCNRIDTSGCSIYSASCGSSWGNYIILAHSDGRYTLYAHLEKTNYKVTGSGHSASAGCWIADEGGTGNTSGIKNGCGDHVHFQWQNSGSINGASVSGSFVETSLGTGSCGSHACLLGSMSCVL